MKKIIAGMMLSAVISGVYAGGITGEDLKKDPILEGKLIAKHCAWCHDVKKKLIAPPFKVIMERYKDVPEDTLRKQLFQSIKYGSKGKWAQWMKENLKVKMGKLDTMYMPAQKPYYTDEEIRKIINWLLTLKK
ncbi:c-type cytochrome [Persephonella sp.]|nr:cytochrome c [Aquificota bacterium]